MKVFQGPAAQLQVVEFIVVLRQLGFVDDPQGIVAESPKPHADKVGEPGHRDRSGWAAFKEIVGAAHQRLGLG